MNRQKKTIGLFLTLITTFAVLADTSNAEQTNSLIAQTTGSQPSTYSMNLKIGPIPAGLVKSIGENNVGSYVRQSVENANGAIQNINYERPRESNMIESATSSGRNGNGRMVMPLFTLTISF